MTARTQDEIVARLEAVKDDDWLGFKHDVLVPQLDFEHARPYLKPTATAESWNNKGEPTAVEVETEAAGYLTFAIGKIVDHRGISASRSVDKLTEYAWLLGRDDVVAAMDEADYPQYGAPKVKAFAEGMGWPWPDGEALARMASGEACEPGCQEGCAS
jgi:hypothetical protein